MACSRVIVTSFPYFEKLKCARPAWTLLIKLPPFSYYFSGLYPESAMEYNLCFKCLLTKPCNKSSVSTELQIIQACLLKSIIKNVFTYEVEYIITWGNLCKWPFFFRVTLQWKWSRRWIDEWNSPSPSLPHLVRTLQLGIVLMLLPGTTYNH